MISLPSLAYWSCAWPYRTEINVQENSGSNLDNYQIRINVSASDLNSTYNWTSNGFDLRVIDSDDETQLDFWVDQWDQAAQTAVIWVRFNQLSASQNRTIYFYYGNNVADQLANVPFTFTNPGIKFHTRRVTSNPTSLVNANNLFNTAGDGNAGYGCTFITNFTDVENSSEFGSNINFIAYSETYFNVASGEAGTWNIRYGGDFGGGGGLYVDGVPLEEQWDDDLWWDNDWSDSDEVLEGSIFLSQGFHKLEVIGQEGGNDGGITVQFQRPGDAFTSYNTGDIQIVSRACPVSVEPSVSFGAQATATCPAAIAQYRLDEGGWGGSGDVIDQSGNFPGTMTGSFLEELNTQVCDGVKINNNTTINEISALQTGVNIVDDVGPIGSIGFWTRTEDDWDSGNVRRTLMDASLYVNGSASDRYFFLEKRTNGSLIFRFEDTNDGDFFIAETPTTARNQGQWYHITVTWDFANDAFQIYEGDTLIASGNPNTSGNISQLGDIYIGDNSSIYNVAPGSSSDATFDEVTIYNSVLSVSEIRGLMAKTRECDNPTAGNNCDVTFSEGLTALDDGIIDFGFNAQLLNNPDNQLSAGIIFMNAAANQFTCGGSNVCTNGDPTIGSVSAGPFQTRTSTTDISVAFRATGTVGATTDRYRNISTNFRSVLNFSDSTYTEFFINNLSIGSRNTVNLAPGTYWINNLSIGSRSTFNVVGSGPVRLYVNNVSFFNSNVTINSPSIESSGSPETLLLYFYDTNVSLPNNFTVSGTVYSEGDITLSSSSYIFGLLSAKNIDLGSNSSVTYDATAYDGLGDITWCESNAVGIGSITVSAPAVGINCLPVAVDITVLDTNGDVLDTYDQAIALSSETGVADHGDWLSNGGISGTLQNGTADDGIGTYIMADADDGDATLYFSNTHAESTELTVSAEGFSDSTTVVFQPSGFVFSNIATQTSALQSPSVSIRAVETDLVTGTCQPLLINTQQIQMAVECLIPNNCGAPSTLVNTDPVIQNTAGNVNNYSAVGLDFGGATSDSADFNLTYSDAGSLRLYARYELLNEGGGGTGNFLTGSSNEFVTVPAGFCIEPSDANWQCTVPGLSANCSAFKQAGEPFDLVVTAKQYMSGSTNYCNHGTTLNFNSLVNVSHNLTSPTIANGGEIGNFSLNNVSLTSGSVTSPVNIDEMGVFTVTAGGNTYTGLGVALPTNTSANIGRFYPKDFNVISSTDASYSDGNTGFTYTGQLQSNTTSGAIEFNTEPTFNFVARGYNNQTLSNYISPFYETPTITATAGSIASGSSGITANLSTGTITGPNANNQYTYEFNSNDHFVFNRDLNSLKAPFTNDTIITITNISTSSTSLAASYDINGAGGEIRYGRIHVDNAYGSETQTITQSFQAEYFNGTQFVLNTLDSGTNYDVSNVQLITVTDQGNSSDPLLTSDSNMSGNTSDIGTFSSGVFEGVWSVPSGGRYGTYNFFYDAESWLMFDWDGSNDGVNEDPSANVSFGQYRGHDRVIYWKEIRY
jgi:hypothetical protein